MMVVLYINITKNLKKVQPMLNFNSAMIIIKSLDFFKVP